MADDANLTLKSDQSTLEVVVLGMIDGFAFGKGIDGRKTMGGWMRGGRGAKRRGVKILGNTGKNGVDRFAFHISNSISICSLRYLKVTSHYSYSREVGKFINLTCDDMHKVKYGIRIH